MADFDGYAFEKGVVPFYEFDGFHLDGMTSTGFDGFGFEKGVVPFYEFDGFHLDGMTSTGFDGFGFEKGLHPFSEYDDESFCTCVTTTPPIHTTGITAAPDQLTVHFNDLVVLSGPALDPSNWSVIIQTGPAREVEVTGISISGSDVILVTTPQTGGAGYILELPTLGITSTVFGLFTGLFSLPFVGVPTIVTLQLVKTIDARTIDVIFGIPVSVADATNPLNYSVDNGLVVLASERITDFNYRLTTTRQTNDTVYTITASNIGPL